MALHIRSSIDKAAFTSLNPNSRVLPFICTVDALGRLGDEYMNVIVKRGSTLLAAAFLAACVAQRDNPPDQSSQSQSVTNSTPHPDPHLEPGPVLAQLPEEKIEVANAERDQVTTGVALPSAPTSAPMASRFYAIAKQSRVCCVMPADVNTEKYQHLPNNPIHLAAQDPVSTFSIDVDTGSYSNVRRYLTAGQLPPQDAVRVEEMINYFDYNYRPPITRDKPFDVSTELAAAPWNPEALLLKIGIKGYEVANVQRPPANLVFLIDVSGSMDAIDKLPLLKNAISFARGAANGARPCGHRGIRGRSAVVARTDARRSESKILEAIDRLEAGGSTNGARDSARLRLARAELHQGRHQPRDPGHRRRLQRRRDVN